MTVSQIAGLSSSSERRIPGCSGGSLWLDSIKNIHFEHIKGSLNKIADYLSRRPYDDEAPAPTKLESQILEEEICIISQSPTQDFADESLQGVDCFPADNNVFAEECDSESDNDSCFDSATESECEPGVSNQTTPIEFSDQNPEFVKNINTEFNDVFETEKELNCIELFDFKSQCAVISGDTSCPPNFQEIPDQKQLIEIFEKHAARITKPKASSNCKDIARYTCRSYLY